jgi:hypothetical protein
MRRTPIRRNENRAKIKFFSRFNEKRGQQLLKLQASQNCRGFRVCTIASAHDSRLDCRMIAARVVASSHHFITRLAEDDAEITDLRLSVLAHAEIML